MIPEFFEYLRDRIDDRVEQVNTCIPAQVTRYYPESQRLDANPCLKRPMRTDTEGLTDEPLPELFDIPVAFPRIGNSILHMPPQVGDYVLLLVPQWNVSEWYRTGDVQVAVGDMAHHSLGSVIAIHGIVPETGIIEGLSATDILFGSHKTGLAAGPAMRLTATKVILGKNQEASKRVARKDDSISFNFTSALAALIIAPPTGGPCTLPGGTVAVTGTITGGSLTVEATD